MQNLNMANETLNFENFGEKIFTCCLYATPPWRGFNFVGVVVRDSSLTMNNYSTY